MYFPAGYKYLNSHLWFQQIGKQDLLIGITDFIQKEIGRLELLEIENEGTYIEQNHLFGKLFGANIPFLLRMPVSGKLLSVNSDIIEKPDLINIDPYQHWVAIISVNKKSNINAICYLSDANYKNLTITDNFSIKSENSQNLQWLL